MEDPSPSADVAFSFSKKPIRSVVSQSAFTHMLPKGPGPDSPKHRPPPPLNNIDYDEQIRAPRMLSTNYTYQPAQPVPFDDQGSNSFGKNNADRAGSTDLSEQETPLAGNSGSSAPADAANTTPAESKPSQASGDSAASNNKAATESAEVADSATSISSHYQPAEVDLSKPPRRGLAPIRPALLTLSIFAFASSNLDRLSRMAQPHAENNHMLLIALLLTLLLLGATLNLDNLKLLRAIENLTHNTTTDERTGADSPERFGGSETHQTSCLRAAHLQHVYNLKKPLCTPAVLRPEGDAEDDEVLSLPPTPLAAFGRVDDFPFQEPEECKAESGNPGPDAACAEPTHQHWQPNHTSDHCMRCFEVFGGFLSPQRRRRHHCRFCGFLFCQSCLHKAKDVYFFEIAGKVEGQPGVSGKQTGVSSRASSNSSYGSVGTASTSAASEKAGAGAGGGGGVMMDAQARLVVPLVRQLMASNLSVTELRAKFKSCKMCKPCGENYHRLVESLNTKLKSLDDCRAPYVFVENPYLAPGEKTAPGSVGGPRIQVSSSVADRRGLYVGTVPSDWTWSSF